MMPPVERRICSGMDILSNLPDDVLCDILMRMPFPDVVRTSILSKQWRYKWCKIPQITLDQTLWRIHQGEYFVNIIRHILIHHQGPVKQFTLSIPYWEDFFYFRQLIGFLSANGIEHLNLKFPMMMNPYKLPVAFFNCVLLKHLSLEDRRIRYPASLIGFDRLISLKLYNVTIECTLLTAFISQCPLLEQLVLILPDNFSGVVEIDAPNLKSFDFTGSVWFIILRTIPLLAQVSFAFRGNIILEAKPHYARVFRSLSAVEHLHFDNHSVKLLAAGAGEVPTNLPFRVNCVKNLYLSGIYLGDLYSVACTLCLMRSFACLEYIEIKVDNSAPIAIDNIDLEGAFGETAFINLKKVVIRRIRGTNPHMQLLKLLVAKSPALTRIIIDALTYEDYEILKSLFDNSEFFFASLDAIVVLKY